MATSPGKALRITANVVSVVLALMMFFSASTKLTHNPGAVHVIHDVIGVPLNLFPLLAACEIAGGFGLLLGIFVHRLGVAAAMGLILYFAGAVGAHVMAKDFAGLKAPVVPFLLSCTALLLRLRTLRRA